MIPAVAKRYCLTNNQAQVGHVGRGCTLISVTSEIVAWNSSSGPLYSRHIKKLRPMADGSDRYFAAYLDDLIWWQPQILSNLHAISLHRGI